jgi:immune inhibitor A
VSRSSLSAVLSIAVLAAMATPCGATMPPMHGGIPPEVAAASRAGLFRVPERPSPLGVSAATLPVWRIPVILVSYSDAPLTHLGADFDVALFDTSHSTATGSVYDYYRWASGNRLTVAGRVVATVQLPNDKLYYGYNSYGLSRTATPHNSAGLLIDALVACSSQVNWAEFDQDRDGFVDMIWVVHQGIPGEVNPDRFKNDLWSMTSRLNGYWSNATAFETNQLVPGSTTQHYRIDRFTVLPELSYIHQTQTQISEIGVYCHEFGHALGLPDLYNVNDGGAYDAGPANWSLMATGAYGGDGISPEYPTHLGAWPSLFLGWTQAIRPSGDTPVVLPPIASTSSQVLELSFQGEDMPEHFLVETRRREGFDRNLPVDGLVVYHLDESIIGQGLQSNTVNSGPIPGLNVLEADGHQDLTHGINRGDTGDVFPGSTERTALFDFTARPNTCTFAGAPTNLALFDIAPVTEGMSFFAQVRAPGWEPAADRTAGVYAPADAHTPANTCALAPDGTAYSVASETRAGHLQVVLRTRRDGAWDAGAEVSQSQGDAFEPALTLLGSHDLAVAWSDTRQGTARLYYRARVGGAWTAERLLSVVPGEYRAPSIAADAKGEVHVAWVFVGQDLPVVQYMRFPYLSPVAQPYVLSGSGASPATPFVVAQPRGGAVVIWTNSATWPPALWFTRCGPDSLPGPPLRLTNQSGNPQTWVSAQAESDGSIHSLWIESGTSSSEIHYQLRRAFGGYAPEDTTLETSSSTLARARIARDASGTLHVVFERSVNGVTQIRYRRRRPAQGWEAGSTDVTAVENGAATQPAVLPSASGNVLVLFRGYQGTSPRFMERQRLDDLPAILAVSGPAPPVPTRGRSFPNPVRAGQAVELRWSPDAGRRAGGPTPDAFEIYDLGGRRIADVGLESDGPLLIGRLPSGLTRNWPAGVYFVRPRGSIGPAHRLVILR